MGKTWGINDDKWHGFLAIIVVAVVFAVLWIFLTPLIPLIKGKIGNGLTFIIYFMFAVGVAHYLQCWNESRQALDAKLLFKYSSYERFIENSHVDFMLFWKGILFSWIIPVLLVLIFSN